MAKGLTLLIEDVYVELGMDHLRAKPFGRRMVARVINRGLGYLSSKGIHGRWWQNDAVALAAGTTQYIYTPPAHIDDSGLPTTVKSIAAVRRDTDGRKVDILTPELLRLMLLTPPSEGPPEACAFFVSGEATSVVSDANRTALQVLVYPAPRSSDLPCNLDFFVSTIQSMRFQEWDDTWQIDLSDVAEMALVLVVASELAGRSEATASLVPGFTDRMEALIREESMRQYSMPLADDIVQVEN